MNNEIPLSVPVQFAVQASGVEWRDGRMHTGPRVALIRGASAVPPFDSEVRWLRVQYEQNPNSCVALAVQIPGAELTPGPIPGTDLEVLESAPAPGGPAVEVYASHPMITTQVLLFVAKKQARKLAAMRAAQ